MKALDEVTAISSRAFGTAAHDGSALAGCLPWAVACPLAAILAVLGLRPRLAEFR